MENISGVFKNTDTTLTIVSSPKNYTDIVDQNGQVSAFNLGALFGKALATDVGKCTMTKGNVTVEMTYTYNKGFLTTKDQGGNESVFAYYKDCLYYLDPAKEYSMILGR